jgi:hypothetical protein
VQVPLSPILFPTYMYKGTLEDETYSIDARVLFNKANRKREEEETR